MIRFRAVGRQPESYPETGLEEINGNLLEGDLFASRTSTNPIEKGNIVSLWTRNGQGVCFERQQAGVPLCCAPASTSVVCVSLFSGVLPKKVKGAGRSHSHWPSLSSEDVPVQVLVAK